MRAALAVATLLAAAVLPGGTGAAVATVTGAPSAEVVAAPAGAPAGPMLRPSLDGDPAPSPAAEAPPAPRPVQTASPPVVPLFGLLPAVELRTLLVGLHLLGLCFGLGGSTLLYFWVFRWIRWGALPPEILRTFDFVAKTVAVGLVLLWLSGIGFLASYWLWDPAKLANPKILAKLVIVTALSLNGLLVHRAVSPFVHAASAMPLLRREGVARRFCFIASGTVSGTSWYAAFALGLLHEFNGKVPAGLTLAAWTAAMGCVFLVMWTVVCGPGRGRAAFGADGCGGTPRAMVR